MQPEQIINDAAFWTRMDNWYRSVHVGMPYGCCGSIESRYRSPQVWESQSPRIPVDRLDADMLEEVWRTLPLNHRLMVRYWWIRKMRPELIMRKLKMRAYLFDGEVRKAIMLMHDRLHLDNGVLSVYKYAKPELTV